MVNSRIAHKATKWRLNGYKSKLGWLMKELKTLKNWQQIKHGGIIV